MEPNQTARTGSDAAEPSVALSENQTPPSPLFAPETLFNFEQIPQEQAR